MAARLGSNVPGWRLALLVVAVLLLVRVADPGFVEELRLRGFDAAQRLSPRAADDRVLIVAIDDESLAARGQWPWPRTLVADLVRRIAEGRPSVLGIDILFAEPDRFSPERIADSLPGLPADVSARLAGLPASDEQLGAAIATVPTVLVADPSREALPAPAVPQPVAAPVREEGGDPRRFVATYPTLIRTRPEISRTALAEGAVAVEPDRDGILRRVALVVSAAGQLVPAFAVEVTAATRPQRGVVVRTGAGGVERVVAGDIVAPTDAKGEAILHFAPPQLRYFAAADVLDPAFDAKQFAGHPVLLGVSVLGLADQKETPLGLMEGIQVHAQLIQSMLDGSLLQRPPIVLWIELALVLFAGGVAIGVFGYDRPLVAMAAALGLVAVLAGGEFLLFRFAGWLVDGIYAGATGLVTAAVMVTEHLRAAQAERRSLDAELALQRERNARLAGELEAARAIQMGLLPRHFPAFTDRDDIDLYAYIEPAREVGGDLYIFLLVDERRLFFLIGDVSGKGIGAALFMAVTRQIVVDAARAHGADLDGLLGEANQKLASASADMAQEGGDLMFVTAFAGVLDLASGDVVFASAGHDAPFLVGPGGKPRRFVTVGGPPLGVVDEFAFPIDHERMEFGEVLLLYTDGVTEAMNGERVLYGGDRLATVLEEVLAADAKGLIELVTGDVRNFAGDAEQADDIALLAFRRTRSGVEPQSG